MTDLITMLSETGAEIDRRKDDTDIPKNWRLISTAIDVASRFVNLRRLQNALRNF